VPFVNVIALGVFAFRRSPIEEELMELNGQLSDLKMELEERPIDATLCGEEAAPHQLPKGTDGAFKACP
jgi:hypothetical protein